jgi:hypothetical protein
VSPLKVIWTRAIVFGIALLALAAETWRFGPPPRRR